VTQNQEEPVEIFMELGLTYVQARLYLTLVKLGNSGGEVKRICKESNIARQDIYRVLPSLQKLGLAEKIIAKPTLFRAIPIEKGFTMLINKKTSKYNELKKKAKTAFDKISVGDAKNNKNEEAPQFVITSEKGLFFRKVKEDVEETQSSIKIIYAKERMSAIAYNAGEQFEKARLRGIKIQALTTKAECITADRNFQLLKKNPAFELRFVEDVQVGLIMFDSKEVNIRIARTIVPSLWTNNRNVVKLAESYFENIWKKAKTE
jgi:sugar-specific transcriptional regulator TrmB